MANSNRSDIVVASERINRAILILRGHNVMLDSDLADLYHVDVKVLNQAMKRNRARFPTDFMFQLTDAESEGLRSQNVTLKNGRGRHRKYKPYAFTEQGVAMLSGVLHSRCAVRVNIEIMRAFVHQRRWLQSSALLTQRLDALEEQYDSQFKTVFRVIRKLIAPPVSTRRQIGFS